LRRIWILWEWVGRRRRSAGRGDEEQPEREKVRGGGGVEEGQRERGGAEGEVGR
jgi:hypothetical protein